MSSGGKRKDDPTLIRGGKVFRGAAASPSGGPRDMFVQYKEVGDQWFIQEGKAQAECPPPHPTPASWPPTPAPGALGRDGERRKGPTLLLLLPSLSQP